MNWFWGPIINIQTLVQIIAWHRPGNKPLSEPMMLILLTHICITRPQWVKPLVNHLMNHIDCVPLLLKSNFTMVIKYTRSLTLNSATSHQVISQTTFVYRNYLLLTVSYSLSVYIQRPTYEWFFHCNWNSMEISFCFHPSCSELIVIRFCKWHDSCAVMACTKFCSIMIPYNGVTLKPIFHPIWITMETSFVKWSPVQI